MTYKKLIIIIFFLLAAGAGFWVYRSYSANKSYRTNTTDTSYKSYSSNKTDTTNAPTSESKIYTNPDHNFSLQLLPGLTTTSFEEGEGDVVLIGQDKSNESYKTYKSDTTYSAFQMQITIRPFDEDTSLTAARIQKEVPEIKMKDVIAVKAGGTDAVSFIDQNDNTRQIWFVQNRELFQVIALSSFDNITGKLMESWMWK